MEGFFDNGEIDNVFTVKKAMRECLSQIEFLKWNNFHLDRDVTLFNGKRFTDNELKYQYQNDWPLKVTPDGKWLIAPGRDDVINIYNFNDSKRWDWFLPADYAYADCMSVSPDSRRLLIRAAERNYVNHYNILELDLTDLHKPTTRFEPIEGGKNYDRFSFLEDGSLLLVRKTSVGEDCREVEIYLQKPGEKSATLIFNGEIPQNYYEKNHTGTFQILKILKAGDLYSLVHLSKLNSLNENVPGFYETVASLIDPDTGKVIDTKSIQRIYPYGQNFLISRNESGDIVEWGPRLNSSTEYIDDGFTEDIYTEKTEWGEPDDDNIDYLATFGYSPEKSVLAVVTSQDLIRFYDPRIKLKLGKIDLPEGRAPDVNFVEITPDRRVLVGMSDGHVLVYEPFEDEEEEE